MQRYKYRIIAACLIACAAAALLEYKTKHLPDANLAPITQDAYVWQRDWTPDVYQAVTDQQSQFNQIVVLVADIANKYPAVNVAAVHPDYTKLAKSNRAIGLAVRVNRMNYTVQFDRRSLETRAVCNSATNAIAAAHAAGINIAEVQLDFDCPESSLGAYADWIDIIKNAVAPTPIAITALPSWLKDPAFRLLAKSAGHFVIQVHSLHRPTGPDSNLTICDPNEASDAVEKASKIRVPFRVALPTYSYLAAFSTEGTFLGLSAEGPLGSWPAGSILKPMRSDPAAIAALVANWTAHPPSNMTGIVWYRLPVAGDSLNWAPVTLRSVMAGHAPQANLVTELRHTKPGLVDVFVKNTGDADSNIRLEVSAESEGGFIISEGINGFDRLEEPSGSVIFRDSRNVGETDGRRIAPGEQIQVGWLRLATDNIATDREVQAHVTTAHP